MSKKKVPAPFNAQENTRDGSGRWKKGKSGNPKGGKKGGRRLTTILNELLDSPDKKDPEKTVADRLMEVAIYHAAKGNYQFFKEIFDRRDGKVADIVEQRLDANWELKLEDKREDGNGSKPPT